MHHHTKKQMLQKTALFFYKNFNRELKATYSFVFLNHSAKSEGYSQLKDIFLQLPIDYFIRLNKFIIVKPTFFQKASNFVAFNTLPVYLKSRMYHISSGKELC